MNLSTFATLAGPLTVRRLQTPLIIAAIFAIALMAGLITATRRIDPLFLLALPISAIVLQIWQRGNNQYTIGILAIVLSGGLINFFSLPTGTDSRIVISLVIAGILTACWLLEMLLARPRFDLTPSYLNRPLLTYAAISIIAFGWGILFRDSLVWTPPKFIVVQTASLVVNLLLLSLALLVANKVTNLRWLKQLTAAMLGMGILYILIFLANSPLQKYILDNGTRGLFGSWVALLAYALALFDENLNKRVRVALMVLVALYLYRYFVIGQTWVSGWLPLGLGCVVLTFLRSRRFFLICTILGSIYLSFTFNTYYNNIVVGEEDEGSGTGRIGLWEMNLAIVKNHFLLGVGPAGYAVYNMSYHPQDARSTHNNYFDILAQTGVLGSAAFIWLIASFLRTGIQSRRLLQGRRDFSEAFANACLAGVFSIIVAMMLGDWVLPFAYNQTITGFDNACYSWILMGAAVALWRIAKSQNAQSANELTAIQ